MNMSNLDTFAPEDGFTGGADVEGASTFEKHDSIVVRGEEIPVTYRARRMPNGDEFRIVGVDPDPLDLAYAEYRRRHGLLGGREIASWRASLGGGAGVTQTELAKLIGFGEATLKRYETGSLPTGAHETMLRLAMEPDNLARLVEVNPLALPPAKRERVLASTRIPAAARTAADLARSFYGETLANETTGFREFDLRRFCNVVLLLTKAGVTKTKLNKLVFYCDFRWFAEATLSMTGVSYRRIQFGPVPNGYDFLYGLLASEGALTIEEVEYGNGNVGEVIKADMEAEDGVLSEDEVRVVQGVARDFERYTAVEISKYSHEEDAWKDTADRSLISYEHAFELRGLPIRP